MEKDQVLSFIKSQLELGSISKEDLVALSAGEVTAPVAATPHPVGRHMSLVNVFYGIGAIVALTGVIILISQHWTDIGFIGRLLVTGGIAAVAYGVGLVLRAPQQRPVSEVFLAIAGILMPFGVYVALVENGVLFGLTEQTIVALCLAALLGFAWLLTRRSVAALFSILFVTWAYYAMSFKLLEVASPQLVDELVIWMSLVAGIAYVLVGMSYRGATNAGVEEGRSVRTVLYTAGSVLALGAGAWLNHFVWDLLFIPFVFGAFYLSVYLKTRAMLVIASLFLIGHLVWITSVYFSGFVGWPIALVICGFIIIGVGYWTYYTMNKFLKQ